MPRYSWSLRLALSAPFAVVCAVSLGLMAYAHYRTIDRMGAKEADSVLQSNTSHTESELRLLLDTPFHMQVLAAEHIVQARLVQAGNQRGLEAYMRMMFEQVYRGNLGWIDMVQIGTVHGNFIGFSEKTALRKRPLRLLKDDRTGGALIIYDLETGAVVDGPVPYDPRERPWYQLAAQAREPRWTSLYAASTNSYDVGMSATSPVLAEQPGPDGRRQLLGVIASDLSIKALVDIMRGAPLSRWHPAALSYIVSTDGYLVAVSDGSPLVEVRPGESLPRLRAAAASSNALIARSYAAVQQGAPLDVMHKLRIHDANHAMMASRFTDPRGLDWKIVSVVPEAALTGASLRQANLSLLFSLLLALLGLLLGLAVIRRTVEPFRQTAREAAALTISNFADDHPPLSQAAPMRTHVTEALQLTQAFRAMAQRIALQVRRLQEIALIDAVTGLLSLRGLLAAANWSDTREVALVALSVDDYPLVLSTLHAAAGEELLDTIARRLSARVPPRVLRARGEGAQFLLLFMPQDLAQLGDVLAALRQAFTDPLRTGSDELRLHASIGVARGRYTGAEVGSRLHGEATLALAAARRAGSGGAPVHFNRSLFTAATSATRLLAELDAAIRQQRLVLHYQPIVALDGGRIVGLEALVRWPHAERGMVLPAEFIALAEESGLILPLGRWVLERAADDVRRLLDECDLAPDFFVNVNVSVRQMLQSDFVDDVRAVLAGSRLPVGTLKLEITESLLLQEHGFAHQTVQHLLDMGIPLVLDDFGTGYSSLSYLTRLPFHTIKIDRSLLLSAVQSQTGRTILKAALQLAHGLGTQCVVEGVEDEQQVEMLQALGATLAQGYRFAPPMPLDALRRLLARVGDWRESSGSTAPGA